MTDATARALARALSESRADSANARAIRAAMVAGGYDPATVEPDSPRTMLEYAESDGRINNPVYLTTRELMAKINAREDAF